MSWEPSPYAAAILRRREEKLERDLESTLVNRRIAERSAPSPKRDQQIFQTTKSAYSIQQALLEVWDEPHPATMDWADALQAIWAAGRKHHDGRHQLHVYLNPQTLKTARKKEVDLRVLCILGWNEKQAVDEAVICDADAEVVERLIVPGRGLGLSKDEAEVYRQLRHDGMTPEAAAEVARIVVEDDRGR